MSDTIQLSDLHDGFDRLEPGEYDFTISTITPKKSKNDNPMVVASYQVANGPSVGSQITSWYTLVPKRLDSGKIACRGAREIADICRVAGMALPGNFAFPMNEVEAGKLLAKATKGKRFHGVVTLEANKDQPDKEFPRLRILGLAQAYRTIESVDDLAEELA